MIRRVVYSPFKDPSEVPVDACCFLSHVGFCLLDVRMNKPKSPFTKASLEERHQFLNFLLENTPDQIYFKDRESRFICLSKAVAQRLGVHDPAELIGKTDLDLFEAEAARGFFEDEQRMMETGEPVIGKIGKEVHPDGHVTWAYITKLPLRNSEDEIIGVCGINKDFTRIKEMEDALFEERNLLRKATEELEARNAQMEADLRMAREIQEALLPRDYPKLVARGAHGTLTFAHFYRPAAAVGGDFFDIIPLSETRAGVFICDVMGHGMRAALITAVIRALLEELHATMGDPGRFLVALNLRLRAILERVEEPFIATAFFLEADLRELRERYWDRHLGRGGIFLIFDCESRP